jgi:hypothetical protein
LPKLLLYGTSLIGYIFGLSLKNDRVEKFKMLKRFLIMKKENHWTYSGYYKETKEEFKNLTENELLKIKEKSTK